MVPFWPGAICGLSLLLVLALLQGFFSGFSGFPAYKKRTFQISNLNRIEYPFENQLKLMCGVLSKYCNLFIFVQPVKVITLKEKINFLAVIWTRLLQFYRTGGCKRGTIIFFS